ncbi:MAG: acyltransferase [Mycolicibacterium neoaurum]|uniref:acyltransferase family protein n=1 Tax=Mycolicibacterium neoaurum TaxID=1795 RepID=UPI002FFCB22D
MRSGEIKALTGLRLFAAIWVVLFHFRPLLAESIPDVNTALAPILNSGAQGVDLFFILSGFVLAWNYLDRMGPTWSTRDTLHFLWMRLARVWPVYLVTLHLAALWIIFTLYVGRFPSEVADTLTATSYLRQLFLVQLWYQPYFDGSSWNGPAWSISAEWLAYLVFGFLALVVFRMAAATRARSLLLLSFAATLPPVMFLLASGQFYTPWSWLPRILMQFTAGVIACAAVRRLYPSDRARTAAGLVSIALVATIIGSLYWLDEHPFPGVIDSGGVVDLLFVPLVVSLSIGAGTLPWLLAHRVLIYGGQISFSLYMVHELVHTAWIWAAKQFELTMAGPGGAWWLVAVFLITLTASAALYHLVEEPARIWMRRMVGRKKPAVSVHAVDSETRLSA